MDHAQLHFFADEIYQLEKEAGGLTALAKPIATIFGRTSAVTRGASRVAKPEALAQLNAATRAVRNTVPKSPERAAAIARRAQAHKSYSQVSRRTRIPAPGRRADGTLLPPVSSPKPLPPTLRSFAKKSGETTATVQRAGDTVTIATQRAASNPIAFGAINNVNRVLQNPAGITGSGAEALTAITAAAGSGALRTGGAGARRAGRVLDAAGEFAAAM